MLSKDNPILFAETRFGISLRRVTRNEYVGPCPLKCGMQGRDRFHVWADKGNYWCRQCGSNGFLDEFDKDWRPDAHDIARLAAQAKLAAKQREAEERAEEELLVKELNEDEPWITYYENLRGNSYGRLVWDRHGIPIQFQDYWQLGLDLKRKFWDYKDQVEYTSPTLAIPIFEAVTRRCMNVRHRILKPHRENDKYRPERAGLPSYPFVANVDEPIANKVLLVEGEKKAMVSWITAADARLQVIGIPGKSFLYVIAELMCDVDPLYVCLDPDVESNVAREFAEDFGKERTRLIELPEKIDDLILKYKLDKKWILGMMNKARRIE